MTTVKPNSVICIELSMSVEATPIPLQ